MNRRKLRNLKNQLKEVVERLRHIQDAINDLPKAVIAELLKPVGIGSSLGSPTNRPPILHNEISAMSKKCTVTLVKKGQNKAFAAPGAKAAGTAVIIQDNQDNTCTVFGVDAAGAPVDISAVATITDASDNTAVLTVDPPALTAFGFHGVAPGSANINIVATWNDNSVGPFNLTLPATVGAGPATGLAVTLGVPTSR